MNKPNPFSNPSTRDAEEAPSETLNQAARPPHIRPHHHPPQQAPQKKNQPQEKSLMDAVAKSHAPSILPTQIRLNNIERPVSHSEQKTPSEPTSRKALANALRIPQVPRSVKVRRTRFINNDASLIKARDRIAALLANVYEDPDAVCRRLETRLTATSNKKLLEPRTAAARLIANPGTFDARGWRGRQRADWRQDVPSEPDLSAAFTELVGALLAARAAAIVEVPLKSTVKPRINR